MSQPPPLPQKAGGPPPLPPQQAGLLPSKSNPMLDIPSSTSGNVYNNNGARKSGGLPPVPFAGGSHVTHQPVNLKSPARVPPQPTYDAPPVPTYDAPPPPVRVHSPNPDISSLSNNAPPVPLRTHTPSHSDGLSPSSASGFSSTNPFGSNSNSPAPPLPPSRSLETTDDFHKSPRGANQPMISGGPPQLPQRSPSGANLSPMNPGLPQTGGPPQLPTRSHAQGSPQLPPIPNQNNNVGNPPTLPNRSSTINGPPQLPSHNQTPLVASPSPKLPAHHSTLSGNPPSLPGRFDTNGGPPSLPQHNRVVSPSSVNYGGAPPQLPSHHQGGHALPKIPTPEPAHQGYSKDAQGYSNMNKEELQKDANAKAAEYGAKAQVHAQQEAGKAAGKAAEDRDNQKAAGEALASKTDNKLAQGLARNSFVQKQAGKQASAQANNPENQQSWRCCCIWSEIGSEIRRFGCFQSIQQQFRQKVPFWILIFLYKYFYQL